MHSVIRSYRLDDGDLDELMHRIDTDVAEKIAGEPGFVAYECVKTGDDTLTTISTFSDEAGCERSNELAAEFVRNELSDMSVSRLGTDSGPVAVSRAAQEILEPAHA
jgi:hypothetical protein